MLLLDLPAELVRQVLHSLDPESFYMCLQTSKLFRAHAINSSSLLRDQLARVPGQRSIEIDTSTDADALVKVFSKRAAQHLLHGGSWLADLRVWRPTSRVDWKKCTIVPHSTLPWDYNQQNFYLTFIEVRSEDATIRIHFVEKNHTGEYRPRLQHVISSHCLPQYFPIAGEQFVRYEILKVAIYEPSIKDLEDSDELPFRQLAVLYRANLTTSICSSTLMKLIMFRLDADFGPRVVRTFDMTGSKAEEAVALAISSSCLPVILYRSYRHIDSPIARYRITTFRNEFDECTLETRTMEDSEYIDPSIQRSEERIAGITIHGKHAHLYPALLPIPQWTIRRISNLRDRIERRDTHLPDQIDEFQKQSLGKALAHYHHHRICDKRLNDGEPTCINTVLQLMISRTESFGVFSRIGAYLIKGIHFPSYCKPFDLNKDYHTLTHVYVAGLAGLPDLYDLSSLGLRLAISPGANRIAIASWRTVKVWALDPKAFLNPEYGLRKAEGVPGDYCYIQGPGWQFYSANRIWGKDCVLLEPVELVSAGVVYGLEFRGEDELWGTTEMGLCRWGFGVKAQGRREEGLLE